MRQHKVNKVEAYNLSVLEVGEFLTSGNPRFHESDQGYIRRLNIPTRVVYRMPDEDDYCRLATATDEQLDVSHLHRFFQEREEPAARSSENFLTP
jgi:hypothetical protein